MCSLMHVMCAVNVCHMCAICVQQMCDIQMDVCRKNANKKKLDGCQTRAKYVGTGFISESCSRGGKGPISKFKGGHLQLHTFIHTTHTH